MTTLRKPIWFKFEDHHVDLINHVTNNKVIFPCEAIKTKLQFTGSANSLTLQIKKESVTQYITLDDAGKVLRNW